MIINKPYYRIRRCKRLPAFYDGHTDEYVLRPEYMPVEVRHSMVRAFDTLLADLMIALNFIEPDDANLAVYSTRLYELLLRAATEFESNCKGIMHANGYRGKGKGLTIKDYRTLDSVMKLSVYEVRLSFWNNGKVLKPLSNWVTTHSLDWYTAYNEVKHNRVENFRLANLENVLNAIAAVACIVYAQLGPYMSREQVFAENLSDGRSYFEYKGIEILQPSFEEDEYNIKYQESYEFEKYPFSLKI